MKDKYSQAVLLNSSRFERETKYWEDLCKGKRGGGFTPDFPRPLLGGYQERRLTRKLESDGVDRLFTISKQSNSLLFMLLASGVTLLLHKYLQEDEVMIGTSVFEKGLGSDALNFFLPVNSTRGEEDSYKEYVKQLSDSIRKAVEHQNIPVQKLEELLGTHQDNQTIPLINTYVLLDNLHDWLGVERLHPDIAFGFTADNGSLQVKVIYNAFLYEMETIERLVRMLGKIYDQISFDPGMKLAELEIVCEQDRHRLLKEFNATAIEYPIDRTVHQLFEEQVERTPYKTAVVFEGESLTYADLNGHANSLAQRLRQKGIGREDIVGIMVNQTLDMMSSILGVLKAGASYLPIDPAYPENRIRYMLEDSRTSVLLTNRDILPESWTIDSCKTLLLDEEDWSECPKENLEHMNGPGDLAYVIYTSGSTGLPKGVMIEHRALINLCEWHKLHYSITDQDRSTKFAGFGFDASVWEIFPYLLVGAELHIISDELKLDIRKLSEYYKEHGITVSFLPTQIAYHYMRHGEVTVQQLLVGGDKLQKYVPGPYRLFNNYGPTESTVVATSMEITEGCDRLPIGKPISNTRVYILDKALKLQPLGAVGELCISGASLARGYLYKETLTADKFVDNPYEPGQRMYRTGDLGRWLPNGTIEYLGRIDDQLKIRGYRIELGEIENSMLKYPDIRECIVLARDFGAGNNKQIVGYYVADGEIPDLEIKQHLREFLPDFMVPSFYKWMEELPLTQNGKVDKRNLPEISLVGNSDIPHRQSVASTEIERTVGAIWREVLGTPHIRLDDNFFDIGGNSMLLVIMHSMLERAYPNQVTVSDIFSYPTIAKLAAFMSQERPNLQVNVKLHRLLLPETYFNRSRDRPDTSLIAINLNETYYSKLKLISGEKGIRLSTVLLSTYLFLLTSITEQAEKICIYTILQNNKLVVPLQEGLEGIENFDQLFDRVESRLDSLEYKAHTLESFLNMIDRVEDENSITVGYTDHCDTGSNYPLDLILKFNDYGTCAEIIFDYNGDRLRRSEIEDFACRFANLVSNF